MQGQERKKISAVGTDNYTGPLTYIATCAKRQFFVAIDGHPTAAELSGCRAAVGWPQRQGIGFGRRSS